MVKSLSTLLLTCTLAGVATLASAGTVEVKFTEPAKFADIGRSSSDQEHTLDVLRRHFTELGRKLPESQSLSVEITDVDLAGELRWIGARPDLRVLRGRADWPRISLRYTLSDGPRMVRQGQDDMADPAYMISTRLPSASQELGYERRMIDRWFLEKIMPATP